ncbi:tRNA lysidine(34) synthetase TilS [Spiroplasma endosymbiont of Diplazon laetatorius]|uniref:tRNA lysidine(34) synthetase TilS n=1 Tax=Spiroplasma endosymbiont of Diplazon laetatorius TaxID=3066322 RepID=UPI0030D282CF
MLDKSKKYILGLSGGADSVFLFHKLIEQGINNFVACHVNYNFRSDSKRDVELVTKLCEKYSIELITKEIVQDYSNLKDNFEAWAREVRYDFFVEELQKKSADEILIAHNLNDHIETYLMHKEKNLPYYGIQQHAKYKKVKIFRPILNLKKSFIVKTLKEKKIDFIVDSTNLNTEYERNRVRSIISEDDFDVYLKEIEFLNSKNKMYMEEIKNINFENPIDINIFKEDKNLNEQILYTFFINQGLEEYIYNAKKAFVKEVLKQLLSNKSHLEIFKGDKVIFKDYKKISILKTDEIEIFEKHYPFEKDSLDMLYKNKIKQDDDLIITNDWKKYQSEVTYKGKKLSKVYKNKKTNYIDRYKNILIFSKTNKIVLNNLGI